MIQESLPAIQVFLASTQTIFRAGLRSLLDREPDLRVVGEASEATDVLRLVGETKPDIVLLDLPFRGLADVGNFGALKNLFDQAHTLLLSDKPGDPDTAQALSQGAGGVVHKSSNTDVLIRGIRKIIQGHYWVGREATGDCARASIPADADRDTDGNNPPPSKCFGLTSRQLEVVQRVVSGFSNKEIATQLSISDDTVKHHLTHVFDKMGVYSRLELTLFAIHHGLVGKPEQQNGYRQ